MIPVVRLIAGGAALLLLASSASAELNPRQLKKKLKAADESWQEGRTEVALSLYEEILDATEPGAAERPDALYAVIVSSLSPEAATRDMDRVQAFFTEYSGFYPRHPRRLEVETLRHFVDAAMSLKAKSRRLEQELAEERESSQQALGELEELREEDSDEDESLAAQIKKLGQEATAARKNLASCRADLDRTREELAEKEDALEKLKTRALSRSGG